MTDEEFFCEYPGMFYQYEVLMVSVLAGSTIMTMNTKNIISSAHELAIGACKKMIQLRKSTDTVRHIQAKVPK